VMTKSAEDLHFSHSQSSGKPLPNSTKLQNTVVPAFLQFGWYV
jgi:hypothetical protein